MLLTVVVCGIIATVIVTDPQIPINGFDEFSADPLNKIADKCEICDKNGDVIFLASENGNPKTVLSELSENTVNAFIAIEVYL